MQPAAHPEPTPITTALVAICCLLALATHDLTALLAYDRDAIQAGQFWRCWTGHLVHFSGAHAAFDIAVLFVASRIAERELGPWPTGLAFFVGAPLISLGLLLMVPDLRIYAGASGISTLMGVAAGTALWRAAPALRGILGLLGAAIIAKTMLDASGALPEFSSLPVGVRVAWQAHVIGGALGALLVAHHLRMKSARSLAPKVGGGSIAFCGISSTSDTAATMAPNSSRLHAGICAGSLDQVCHDGLPIRSARSPARRPVRQELSLQPRGRP